MVLTQDVRQVAPNPRDKSCPFFTRRHLKLRVVAREEFLPDEPVRRFQARDPAKRQFLRQPVLERPRASGESAAILWMFICRIARPNWVGLALSTWPPASGVVQS